MCELFGASCETATSFSRELAEFRLRGGLLADNPDGWGLAWRDQDGFRLTKEPNPAHLSTQLRLLGESVRSDLLLAHVRKARFPPVNTFANTHPFRHDCCGKTWVFAHNGLVPDVVALEQRNNHAVCKPAGETDSEYAFCHLLRHIADYLAMLSPSEATAPFPTVATVSELIAGHGKFNFLLSDGEYLMAYGHDRLHYRETGASTERCAMVATEPLPIDDGWKPFAQGELRIYRRGRLAGRSMTKPHQQPLYHN